MEQSALERYKKKLDELRNKKRKDWWFPNPGKNYIRVLPNWKLDPTGDFYRETAYHRHLGVSSNKSVVCPKKEGHAACPVCDLVGELWKTKKKEDAELAKSIKKVDRVYYNIVDLNDKDKGVQVYITGNDILEQMIAYCANPKYGDISDPIEGRNIELTLIEGKNTKSGYNEYILQPDPTPGPVDDVVWLTQLVDLNSMIKPISVEMIQALLTGEDANIEDGLPPEQTDVQKKPEEPVKAASEIKSAGAPPPCFEMAKFSADDSDCAACDWKIICEDKKKKVVRVTKQVEAPATAASVAAPAPTVDSSQKIKELMSKIRAERSAAK